MSRPRRARTEQDMADSLLDVLTRIADVVERIVDRPQPDRLAQEVVKRIAPRPHPKTKPNRSKK